MHLRHIIADGVKQDMAEVRDEIERLRKENKDLEEELRRSYKQPDRVDIFAYICGQATVKQIIKPGGWRRKYPKIRPLWRSSGRSVTS